MRHLRQQIIQKLWDKYRQASAQFHVLENHLKPKGIPSFVLDHFAIIDLPGPNTGITQLQELFTLLGFEVRGRDYLKDKQNDFIWMAETNCHSLPASTALPQVVVADFRLTELPLDIRKIIQKYARQAPPTPIPTVRRLIQDAQNGDTAAIEKVIAVVEDYFSGRDWDLPTIHEFQRVQSFNELLAWVLIFGRTPNHFTLSTHLFNSFHNFNEFISFIEHEAKLGLNTEGGKIKGGPSFGIAQSSTQGEMRTINLPDGEITLPAIFVEFVWRYADKEKPILWSDYFTGFIAQHANQVIESLYEQTANA